MWAIATLASAGGSGSVLLPTGWRLSPPTGPVANVGLFPQGIALSPDGRRLAVVDSGMHDPALAVLSGGSLAHERTFPLPGAFGYPVWLDATHAIVAGANDDAIEEVDVADGSLSRVPLPKGSWPAQVAVSPDGRTVAASDHFTDCVSIRPLQHSAFFDSARDDRATIHVGVAPSDLLFSRDGTRLFVALRGESRVAVVHLLGHAVRWIDVGLHPDALALSPNGDTLYVAESDGDTLGIVDTRAERRVGDVALGLHAGDVSGYGASPNALAVAGHAVYVSLGAENAVAVVRGDRVAGRIPTGWYPTGIALGTGGRLYVANAKGERSPANPRWNPYVLPRRPGYIGASLDGSVRALDGRSFDTDTVIADAAPRWSAPTRTIVRPNGPIRHVIYVIKENRSYDQILGDLAGADGDSSLVWFGARVTPNQHAIARRFGIFDRAFVDGQVTADGQNWSTAAYANDYVERFSPPDNGGHYPRFDFQGGTPAAIPGNGYLWDDAARNRVSYRDYGEFVDVARDAASIAVSHLPHLDAAHVAPHYPGWNLEISDQVRFQAWKAEFERFVALRDLPQLEIVRLPNDHTMGTAPGELTPQAYVAQNDYALGELVDAVSHSPYWASTAIFAIEDDAQDGPDHVDDQRTTLYVASPYAVPGVHHQRYSTASVLRTVELLLGLPAMSVYDAVARPLYEAFRSHPDLNPYDAISPNVDVRARNSRTAYGASRSARMDFSRADAEDPRILDDILAHAARSLR